MAANKSVKSIKEPFLCLIIILVVRMLMVYTGNVIIGFPLIDKPLAAAIEWLKSLPFSAYLGQLIEFFKSF